MCKKVKNRLFKNKGQVAIEYALAMVVMAIIASCIWIFYQGLADQTFYGAYSETRNMGFERTISNSFP